MDELSRFRCSACRQETTFRPGVFEALFDDVEPQGPFRSYIVSCRHCRRHNYLVLRRGTQSAAYAVTAATTDQ